MAKLDVLTVSNFAHIKRAEIEFGDLTVLVGAQATGKSLLLQLLKLAVDGHKIAWTMKAHGLLFPDDRQFLARYLGAGTEGTWKKNTRVAWNDDSLELEAIRGKQDLREQAVYFIPAHRALTLAGGFPPMFQQFSSDTPFVVRQFSEAVRKVLAILGGETLFPSRFRPQGTLRNQIDEAIFHGGRLLEDTTGIQRQLKLDYGAGNQLPYMTWTAGQREFIPLLLGVYALWPATGPGKAEEIEWVVIEEPEMGLHPDAQMAFMLLVLDLLARGYKVVLSTHSPMVLDVVWALGIFKRFKAKPQRVLELFGITGQPAASLRAERQMARRALEKSYRVHFLEFKGATVQSRDISTLDPGSEDPVIAGWGGLSGWSGLIGNVIAKVVNGSPHG